MKRLALLVCFLLIACGNDAGTPATPRATMTPAAGAALVEQAVSLLLERYVEPLGSADLYAAAYRGAVNTLQAAGAAPRPEGARQPPDFTGDPQRDAAIFREAYLELANGAGANVSQTALAYDAIRAVTEKIDECHTSFLTPEQYRQLTARLEGTANYAGIGAGIRPTRPPTIGKIFPGTPAERGGLRPGDAILAVDGTDVTELTAEQIAQLVRGPAGTQVTLTVRRPGETGTRQITLTRARIDLPVLTSRIIEGANGEKIGYLKLYSFSTGAAEQLQEALEAFRQQGVTGWVLDLRGNGGGYIDTLSKIASRFIAGGQAGGLHRRPPGAGGDDRDRSGALLHAATAPRGADRRGVGLVERGLRRRRAGLRHRAPLRPDQRRLPGGRLHLPAGRRVGAADHHPEGRLAGAARDQP
ncbi:MAG: PDZ domain-containing protein, partial [Chloroflexota bacterium]|nr:PDZ domain-containing protein [Chloroflexota bacterium]